MSEDQELIAHAELGERAREFLASELGRLVVGYAQQEVDDALQALGEVSPTDADEIRKLQNKVQVGRWFSQWLGETVDRGDSAIAIFRQKRQETS